MRKAWHPLIWWCDGARTLGHTCLHLMMTLIPFMRSWSPWRWAYDLLAYGPLSLVTWWSPHGLMQPWMIRWMTPLMRSWSPWRWAYDLHAYGGLMQPLVTLMAWRQTLKPFQVMIQWLVMMWWIKLTWRSAPINIQWKNNINRGRLSSFWTLWLDHCNISSSFAREVCYCSTRGGFLGFSIFGEGFLIFSYFLGVMLL